MIDYKIVNEVCRPQTQEALENFKGIQREANRSLDATDRELLWVDGRIGNKTRLAVNSILGTSFKTCSDVAISATMLYEQLRALANGRQLVVVADPDRIIPSIISPPSKFDPDTNTVVHPSIATAGFAGVPLWILALGGVGGYYYLYKTKGGKKTRKSLTGGF